MYTPTMKVNIENNICIQISKWKEKQSKKETEHANEMGDRSIDDGIFRSIYIVEYMSYADSLVCA